MSVYNSKVTLILAFYKINVLSSLCSALVIFFVASFEIIPVSWLSIFFVTGFQETQRKQKGTNWGNICNID